MSKSQSTEDRIRELADIGRKLADATNDHVLYDYNCDMCELTVSSEGVFDLFCPDCGCRMEIIGKNTIEK